MALAHCEARLGAAWVCCPARWGRGPDGTLDGCVPVRVVWARFQSLAMHDAKDALETARGINLALSGEDGADVRIRTAAEVYPSD